MWSGSHNADSPPALGRNFGSYDPSISLMEADRLAASCLVRVQTSSSSSKDLQIKKKKEGTDHGKCLRQTVEACAEMDILKNCVLLSRKVYTILFAAERINDGLDNKRIIK